MPMTWRSRTVVELVKLYENDRRNIILSSTPAYDYAPNPDKQWILQVTKQMQPIHRQFTDLLMTKRLQTLQSVDEAVDRGGPRKSSPPPISGRRLIPNWSRSIPFHPYCDMNNEQVNCLSKAQDGVEGDLPPPIQSEAPAGYRSVETGWEHSHVENNCPRISGHDLNLNLSTNLVQCKSTFLYPLDDHRCSLPNCIYQELKALGELDNTYIIYTSDHGYHLGQFGLVKGKSFPFEFDVRVPFLVRGPGIEPGTKIDEIVLNLDLAPTFLDIAGVDTPSHMDGRSFLPLLHRISGRREIPEAFLEDKDNARRHHHQGIYNTDSNSESLASESSAANTTAGSVSATFTTHDPNQLIEDIDSNNDTDILILTADDDDSSLDKIPVLSRPDLQFDNRVLPVVPSSGITNKLERIALECQSPEFQAPCRPGQKWQCVSEGNRWRKHKCKFQTVTPHARRKKCLCFTPAGLEYTRLEPDERRMQRQYLRSHVSREVRPKYQRSKRSLNLDTVLRAKKTTLEPAVYEELLVKYEEHRRGLREKRDTLEHVSSIMENLQEEIYGLEETQSENTRHSNRTEEEETNEIPGGCMVYPGGVNCSNVVYEDPRVWRSSRNNVEEQIRKLRMQLDTLKEIRRHLRAKRPQHSSYDASNEEDDNEEEGDKELESIDEELEVDQEDEIVEEQTEADDELTKLDTREKTNTTDSEKDGEQEEAVKLNFDTERPHHHHHPHHNGSRKGRRRHKTTTTTAVPPDAESTAPLSSTTHITDRNKLEETLYDEDVKNFVTTQAPSSNPHRHNHGLHTSSLAPRFGENITSESPAILVTEDSLNSLPFDNITTTTPRQQPTTSLSNNKVNLGSSRIEVTVFQPNRGQQSTKPSASVDNHEQHTCFCEPDILTRREEKEMAKEARRRIKEERLKKKERKQKKKEKMDKECLFEKMNCFNHDNDHWKTAPLWSEGPFCFCMNANNNTYSCLRTINATHNFLYCEFVTGLITFYNLRIDPFEQWNRVHSLTKEELSYLSDQLTQLRACRGTKQCTVGGASHAQMSLAQHMMSSSHQIHTNRYKKRKYPLNLGEGERHGRINGGAASDSGDAYASTSNN
uniref:Uncharacterized protein n=1 Tax=Timema tahoe TaxID=61484 RepID=A0A7R9FML6_9NEOP|nr:unnamed protein product [Timema tahoe]